MIKTIPLIPYDEYVPIESPFMAYHADYLEEELDFVFHITDEIIFDGFYPRKAWDYDPDWELDCVDCYGEMLILDLTGNLDAPL